MDTVTPRASRTRQQLRLATTIPPVRLPFYLRVILLTTSVVAVVVVSWTLLVKITARPQAPFSAYTDVFPGQPHSAVLARGISCDPDPDLTLTQYCTHAPSTGPFSLIAMTISDGVIRRVNFTVRENTLRVGDLPLAWGQPNIRLYGHSVTLDWPSIGATANAWAQRGRFSYFMPVQRISLAHLRC